jgi:hypothetical protein
MLISLILGISLTAWGYEVKQDKLLHAGGSFCMTESFMQVSDNPYIRYGLVPAVVAGIGFVKELTDPYHGGVKSNADMNANLIGIGSALILDSLFRCVIIPEIKKLL